MQGTCTYKENKLEALIFEIFSAARDDSILMNGILGLFRDGIGTHIMLDKHHVVSVTGDNCTEDTSFQNQYPSLLFGSR
jgi:hypothetical protein